jgi:hypothetical protein
MADDDQPRERHFNIQTSPEIMAGHYANFANVSHSDYEFTITFARVDHEVEEEEVPGVVVTRVSLAPRFMRELIDAMADNYSRWETREGIRDLPEAGAGGIEGGPSTAGGQGGPFPNEPPPPPPPGEYGPDR